MELVNRNFRYLEQKISLNKSISDLTAQNDNFRSIETSLKSSLDFYKTQLEKSELKNQNFSECFSKVFEEANLKLKTLFEEILSSNQRELALFMENDYLKSQIELERKNGEAIKDQEKALSQKVLEIEAKLALKEAEWMEGKKKLFEKYLKAVQELNDRKETKEILVRTELRTSEETQKGEIFPVVKDDYKEVVTERLMYKEKYKELAGRYEELVKNTEELLRDIEERSPEIQGRKENYERLLSRYENLSQEFYDYKQKNFFNDQLIEGLNKKLSASAEVVIGLKAKISTLVTDLYSLTIENQKLLSGYDIPAEVTSRLKNSIEENINLSNMFEKAAYENSTLKSQLAHISSKMQDLSREISVKDSEISELKTRLSILSHFDSFKIETISHIKEEYLSQELKQKDDLVSLYKEKYLSVLKDLEKLKVKNQENTEKIRDLNLVLLTQSNELFVFKSGLAKPPEAAQKEIQRIEVQSQEGNEKIQELITEKLELTSKVYELINEIQVNRVSWTNEVAKLQAENEILKLVNQTDSNQILEDLASTKSYLREVRYLLSINEKELSDERTKRIHHEKELKKLRKIRRNREKREMLHSESSSLIKSLSAEKSKAAELDEKIQKMTESFEKKETELKDALNGAKELYLKEMKTNEIHQKNLKILLDSFKNTNEMLEKKKRECSDLQVYLDEKKEQNDLFEKLIKGRSSGKELYEMCILMHKRVETFISVQDSELCRSFFQNEVFKVREDLEKTCKENLRLREVVREMERSVQELRVSLKKAEELNKQPEVIEKIVRLVQKSTLAYQRV